MHQKTFAQLARRTHAPTLQFMSLRAVPACVAAWFAVTTLLTALPVAALGQAAPIGATVGATGGATGGGAPLESAADDEPLPIPPVPPRIAEGAAYEACLNMLASDPSGADAAAVAMAANGGGEAAQHCHALAQVELGNTEEGATLLDQLAAGSAAQAASRATVFAQASQAWTMSGKSAQAYASATAALALSPDDPDLLIGHAIAGLALKKYTEAVADLTHALDLDPKRGDALVLRAGAYRNLGKLAEAAADIAQALALDPDSADALLERGILRQRQGDLAGAKADWQMAADLAADTPTGDLAQQNLALLEAGPRQ